MDMYTLTKRIPIKCRRLRSHTSTSSISMEKTSVDIREELEKMMKEIHMQDTNSFHYEVFGFKLFKGKNKNSFKNSN